MRIAIAQTHHQVSNFEEDKKSFLFNFKKAIDCNTDLLVFPELFLGSYLHKDLIYRPEFNFTSNALFDFILSQVRGSCAVAFGHVHKEGNKLFNRFSVVFENKVIFYHDKILLPSYDVFYDSRYFSSGSNVNSFNFKGKTFAVLICEDIWGIESFYTNYPFDPLEELFKGQKLDYLIAPSASPYYKGKFNLRLKLLENIVKKYSVNIVYSNFYGACDDVIFDGNSLFLDKNLKMRKAKAFSQDFLTNFESEFQDLKFQCEIEESEELLEALKFSLREYLSFNGFKRVHLGISGGIDSALVSYIAVKALGSENVEGFALPSCYSSSSSLEDAKALCENLKIKLNKISIDSTFNDIKDLLSQHFKTKGITEENLQARIRALFLMAYSNSTSSLLLTTGNKSELAVGYSTLYGDMCGALNLIGDLFKTEVFKLVKFINEREGINIIPENILIKPPSAELREGQKDEDSLPSYDILDDILNRYIVLREEVTSLKKLYDPLLVDYIIKLHLNSEYKRFQSPIIVKVSKHAFGSGRLIPISKKMVFYYD